MGAVTGPRSEGQPYGQYILRTGTEDVRQLELVYGAYWHGSKFAGKSPILDLGPGRCWFTLQNTKEIFAVDIAPEVVEHYRRLGVEIRLGSAYEIPFADGFFEGVFCCWLLEHLAEPDRAMLEIYRILKLSGYACVIVPSPHDMTTFYDDYTHVRPFTRTSLGELANGAGFARHEVACLPWVRGIRHLTRYGGRRASLKYLEYSDRYLRRLGLKNRCNLMLEAWK